MKWTTAQQRKYRAQVRDLGLDDDEARRALLRALTGKLSTSELDSEELARVIQEQERRLRTSGGHVATQDDKVHGLEKVLGWYGQPVRLKGFIRRQTHGRKLELSQLTPREKSALIEAMKGVLQYIRGRARRARGRTNGGSSQLHGSTTKDLQSCTPAWRGRQRLIYF